MKLPGMKKDLKPIPAFRQNPGEKERHFFKRVNQQVTVSLINSKINFDFYYDVEKLDTKSLVEYVLL